MASKFAPQIFLVSITAGGLVCAGVWTHNPGVVSARAYYSATPTQAGMHAHTHPHTQNANSLAAVTQSCAPDIVRVPVHQEDTMNQCKQTPGAGLGTRRRTNQDSQLMDVGTRSPTWTLNWLTSHGQWICTPENSRSPSQLGGLVWEEDVEGQENFPVSAGFELTTLGLSVQEHKYSATLPHTHARTHAHKHAHPQACTHPPPPINTGLGSQ